MPTRVYFVIFANTAAMPTENQWRAVLGDMVAQSGTLARVIHRAGRAAHNYVSASKRSQGAATLNRYTLGGFELDDDQRGDAVTLLNAIASTRTITGSLRNKFEKIVQAECREAARRQGFSVAQSNLISVSVVGYGERMDAIAEAQAYVAANAAIWYA